MGGTSKNAASGSFAALLKAGLSDSGKTLQELAENVDLTPAYVEGLLDGSIRPPRASRTDIYDRMTRFLRLSRNELAHAASAERDGLEPGTPTPAVSSALLALCDEGTAASLCERGNRKLLLDSLQRLIELMQTSVSRVLSDTVSVRVTATRRGVTYPEQRERVLRFLDTSIGTVTAAQVAEFIEPRLSQWDLDAKTGVLKIVMREQTAPDRRGRRSRAG